MDPFPMTVLLATDGSEEAELAAGMAAGIAKRTGAELHLVCVVDLGVAADPRLQEGLRQRARDLLEDQARKMRKAGDTVAETHMCVGRPDREIVILAEKVGAGLIVIGSRGLGGVRRALIGSVSASVVRHAHCPVLVVRGREQTLLPSLCPQTPRRRPRDPYHPEEGGGLSSKLIRSFLPENATCA